MVTKSFNEHALLVLPLLALLGSRNCIAYIRQDDCSTDGMGRFQYIVTASWPYLDAFMIPAGSSRGVYDASVTLDWAFEIEVDRTLFSATAESGYIPYTEQATFALHSTQVEVDLIVGWFTDSPNGRPWRGILLVPAPEPATLLLLGLGAVMVRKRRGA
ncbi:MAG: PEP-CTERM sorting domain-containing protein [Sedimentisphaerales bacterium]|nr:PEP-CTERM sorting domain-containing protein [Sedimentisphaerales bacterium]